MASGLIARIPEPMENLPLYVVQKNLTVRMKVYWVQGDSSFYLSARAISWSTTAGSARVLMSPSSSSCLDAIFLRIRLIIFPLLVFGSPGAQWILSGVANAPIWNFILNQLVHLYNILVNKPNSQQMFALQSSDSQPKTKYKYTILNIHILISYCMNLRHKWANRGTNLSTDGHNKTFTKVFTVRNTLDQGNKCVNSLPFNLSLWR